MTSVADTELDVLAKSGVTAGDFAQLEEARAVIEGINGRLESAGSWLRFSVTVSYSDPAAKAWWNGENT